jgi:gliding motility-associated-like protein
MADFNISMLECVDSMVILLEDASTYNPDNPLVEIDYEVSIGGSVVVSDSGSTIQFTLLENSNATICQNIKVANGCEVENCRTVQLNLLDLDFDQDVVLCLDEESMISVNHAQGDDITVTWEPNDIIISPLDQNTITVLTSDSIVTALYFTATNEFGCSTSDSVNITTAGKRPGISFLVTQDCGSLKITLDNTSVDSVAVVWNFGDGNTSMEWEPMHTYDAAGTYTITLTGGTVPCDSTYSVTIDIPIETIEFPDTVYQCFEDSLTLNPGGNATWDYVWSPAELFSNPTEVSPKVLVSEVTTVYVMVTVFDGVNFCVHLDSIVVVPVPDFQFDVDPPGDVTVCDSDANSIVMTVQTMEGVEISWKDANGNVLFVGDTFEAPLADGLNTFVVMGVYMGIEECMKSQTINVTLTRLNLSFEIINVDDGTDMFCEPAEGKLIAVVDGPPGNYTYQWAPLDGVISGADSDSLCLMVDQSRTYCVTVTNTDLNCSVEGCYSIEFGAEVVVTLVDGDGIICIGDKVTLVATITPAGSDCSYSWNVPGTTVGPIDQDTICYIAAATGTATVSVGCVGGCTDEASIVVEVRDLSSLITATATPDQVNNPNDIIQLDAVGGDPSWTYSWDGPGLIPPTNIKNPTAMPGLLDPPPTYTVMVIDEFGCEGTSSVTLRQPDVNPCENPYVFIPTAFAPNGDGTAENKVIKIYGTQIDKFFSLIIYNRWGQEVKKFENLEDSWDGTFNGDELEADVYGYYLHVGCINGQESIQQGNISLLR